MDKISDNSNSKNKYTNYIARRYFQIYEEIKEKISDENFNINGYWSYLEKELYFGDNYNDEVIFELQLYVIFKFIYHFDLSNKINHKIALRLYDSLLKLQKSDDLKKFDFNSIKDKINMIYILCDKKPPFLKRIYDICCYALYNKDNNEDIEKGGDAL